MKLPIIIGSSAEQWPRGKPVFVTCFRTSEVLPGDAVPGSIIANCGKCKSPVWLSPKTNFEHRKARAIGIISLIRCAQCIIALVEESRK